MREKRIFGRGSGKGWPGRICGLLAEGRCRDAGLADPLRVRGGENRRLGRPTPARALGRVAGRGRGGTVGLRVVVGPYRSYLNGESVVCALTAAQRRTEGGILGLLSLA